jgi:hypothetical protein
MAWARLDDQFAFNPKIVAAGNDCAGLFARAVAWCSANETNGFVPMHIACILAASRLRNKCVTNGLWMRVGCGDTFQITGRKDSGRRKLDDVEVVVEADGYYIRDFLHYNRARTDARANETADERAEVRHHPPLAARATRPDPPHIETPNQPTSAVDAVGGIDFDKILKDISPT